MSAAFGLMLTDSGNQFAHLETAMRKKLLAAHVIAYVPIIGLIRRVLNERPTHTAPAVPHFLKTNMRCNRAPSKIPIRHIPRHRRMVSTPAFNDGAWPVFRLAMARMLHPRRPFHGQLILGAVRNCVAAGRHLDIKSRKPVELAPVPYSAPSDRS